MKYVKWIFVVLFISSLTSFVEKDKPTSGLNIGDRAPNFKMSLSPDGQQFELKMLKGKYVLLSFWSTYDAQSRMHNAIMSNTVNVLDSNLQLVSVSFDEYKSIFEETIKKDSIDSSSCFVETNGETSPLFKTYRLDKGFNNYLLDDNGVIVAKNLSSSELISYLN